MRYLIPEKAQTAQNAQKGALFMAKAQQKQLKPTNEEIAVCLLECKTQADAADRLNISTRTLYDRLQSFELQSILATIRADQLRSRLQAIDDAQAQAVQTICDIMNAKDSSTSDRLKAAALILESGRAARAELATAESAAVGRLRNARRCDRVREGENKAEDARARGEMVLDFTL